MHIDTSTSHQQHDNAATSPEIHKTAKQKLNQMLDGVGLGDLSASEDSNTNTSSSLSEEPMEMKKSNFSRRWGERKQFLSDFQKTNKFFRQKINKHKLSKQLIQKSKNKSQRLREKQKRQMAVGAKEKGNSMTLKKEQAKNLLAIIPYKPFSLPKRAPVTNPPSFLIPKLPKELPLTFLHPLKRTSDKIPLGNEHQTLTTNDFHNENEAQQGRENSVHTKSNSATAEMHGHNAFAGIYFIVEEKVLKKQVHFFENLKDFC